MSSVLYHYTNELALEAILKQRLLRPSLLQVRRRDVRYGDGQYFTDSLPGSMTGAELSILLVENAAEAPRFTHYVAIDISGLLVVPGRPGVFVIPGRVSLDITGRIRHAGPNL